MKRISTDAEYLTGGTVTVDADGIPITISGKADQSVITGATHEVGRADAARANRLVKLDKNGDLFIATNSIIKDSDPVNKVYVDRVAPIPAFAGTGSPEGKTTASVGTIYTDTAATNGAIRWIKTSGTGNTGWRVEYGDTGWRNITALLGDSVTGGKALIRRANGTVWFDVENLTFPTTPSYLLFSPSAIPMGFRVVSGWKYFNPTSRHTGGSQGPLRVSYGGDLGLYDTTNKTELVAYVSWPTENAWPATLPGTPA